MRRCNEPEGRQEVRARPWGEVPTPAKKTYGRARLAYQTDVGVNAHLDVFPVKFNASGSNPEGDATEQGKGRAFGGNQMREGEIFL